MNADQMRPTFTGSVGEARHNTKLLKHSIFYCLQSDFKMFCWFCEMHLLAVSLS